MDKNILYIGTGFIWMAVLIGTSFLTEADENRVLDWELMWLIVGGFMVQIALINFYIKKSK